MEATLNGRQRGREVPPLPSFTFAGSGREISVRKVSPLTIDSIRAALLRDDPPPAPPLQEVDYGGQVKLEPNPDSDDPAYARSRREHAQRLQEGITQRLMRLVCDYAAVFEVDQAAVDDIRAAMEAIGCSLADKDDRAVYLWHVCVQSPDDLTDLMGFVVSRSRPSEAAVQAHQASFSGDLPWS